MTDQQPSPRRKARVPDAAPTADVPVPATAPSSPAASRRRQEDRSRDAKDRLLQAAIQILLRDGYGGLTTKEVAAAAGLSNGALMHHYGTKAELVVAATAMVYEEAALRGQRVAQTAGAVKNPIEGFITDCLSIYFDWPFIAALETIVVARTDPDLMARMLPVMERYRVSCDRTWLEVFARAGVAPAQAELVLNLSLNLVRGMAVNRLWRHDEAHYRAYLKEWVRIAEDRAGLAPRKRRAAPPKPPAA